MQRPAAPFITESRPTAGWDGRLVTRPVILTQAAEALCDISFSAGGKRGRGDGIRFVSARRVSSGLSRQFVWGGEKQTQPNPRESFMEIESIVANSALVRAREGKSRLGLNLQHFSDLGRQMCNKQQQLASVG